MRRLVLRPTYDSWGDVEILADFLVSLGGVYNVYREGSDLVIEVGDGVNLGEVVRSVLDLGHELLLPHFVFSARPGLDDREVVKRLLSSPIVVAAEYYPRSGRGVLVAVPGASEEEVLGVLRQVFGGASLESRFVQPVRMSFG
ncbi:MAG: hypothetical protein QXI84_07590 [Thermofilaceae archaeon]